MAKIGMFFKTLGTKIATLWKSTMWFKIITMTIILDMLGALFIGIGLSDSDFLFVLGIICPCIPFLILWACSDSVDNWGINLCIFLLVKTVIDTLFGVIFSFLTDDWLPYFAIFAGIEIAGTVIYIWEMLRHIQAEKIRKEVKQRVSNMSQSEREEYLLKSIYSSDAGNERCHSCGKTLISYNGMKRNNDWILTSSEKIKNQKIDKAYTLGGATTVFAKEEEHIVNTYKCPYCGYTRKE